jgi:hypothetical protein
METNITAHLAHDEELVVTKRATRKVHVPAYDCFGGNTNMKTQEPSFPNLYLVFGNLSKPASWMWWSLVKSRNAATNEVVFKAADKLWEMKITKAYKELCEVDLVRRIRRQHYLINPKAVIPIFDNFRGITDKWDNLGDKKVEPRAVP